MQTVGWGRSQRVRVQSAFTLIEILVVVLIIALLIAIALPSLGRARNVARGTVCLSNQRQIGIALVMYADDFEGLVLREGLGLEPGEPDVNARVPWAIGYRPYLDPRVAPDREFGDRFRDASYYKDPGRRADNHQIHYANNAYNFRAEEQLQPGWAYWYNRRGPIAMQLFLRPADTTYLTCFADDVNSTLYNLWVSSGISSDRDIAQFYDLWDPQHISTNISVARIAVKRHLSGSNVLFLDGHAASSPPNFLSNVNNWDDGYYKYREPQP
jgi:prepilin-type N-terminal cleavage/methylation domain-containing protein/prepilin-type processing-associated H-X9-DG protein